jgi:hypothetical protein
VTAPALQRLESIAARLQANADEWHTRASEQERAGGKGGLAAEWFETWKIKAAAVAGIRLAIDIMREEIESGIELQFTDNGYSPHGET